MEQGFDLDINNYTTNDLLQFFKLEPEYSLNDLIKKEEDLATEILSQKNTNYNPKYKFDIISFIKLAKDVLTSFYNDNETNKEITKNIEKKLFQTRDPRVGKIINPLAPHPALEKSIIPREEINGYNYDLITSIYVFNTAARNDYFNTISSYSTYDLPIKWKNVISISLSSANIPNIMYAFNYDSGTNQIYIEEDGTGLSGIVTLPEGNYSPYSVKDPLATITEASFPDQLTKEINEQILGITNHLLYRFIVSISLSNRRTTITNTTYTFSMNTIKKNPNDRCSSYSTNIFNDYGNTPPDKTQIPFTTYIQTLGFLMGYKEITYSGSKSYTSESVFSNTYSNYLYFSLEEYTGSQTVSTTYGVLGENGILDNNIIGIIPISSTIFNTTFDNNSNFIYKKREYFGPVDISRITIKLLNQRGNIVNLQQTDFSFSLHIKTIYNLTDKSKLGLRSQGFL
jgi:hypothetical protein